MQGRIAAIRRRSPGNGAFIRKHSISLYLRFTLSVGSFSLQQDSSISLLRSSTSLSSSSFAPANLSPLAYSQVAIHFKKCSVLHLRFIAVSLLEKYIQKRRNCRWPPRRRNLSDWGSIIDDNGGMSNWEAKSLSCMPLRRDKGGK